MNRAGARHKVYNFLELGSFGGLASSLFEQFMIVLILANVIAVIFETVPAIWLAYEAELVWFDAISVIIFSLEYAARVWVSVDRPGAEHLPPWKARLSYILSPLALIDLLAILPFHVLFGATWDLRILRIFRLLRLLKLVRYSPALASLGRVVYAERRALSAAFIVMGGLLLLSATSMYLVERHAQPDVFGSIPAALWWAVATLTTVGYGDVVPITVMGHIVGGIVMILGLAFFALPIGIVASGFSEEVHRREFVVPARVITDSPALMHLSNGDAENIGRRMRTLTVAPGAVVTHRHDDDNGLYFIISGEVKVYYQHRAIPLRSGDFFGEIGFMTEAGRQPAVVAHTRCRIMWLESTDLHMVLSMYAGLPEQLEKVADVRLSELVEAGHLTAVDRQEMIGWMKRHMVSEASA